MNNDNQIWAVLLEPEYFEPGTLVVLDPNVFDEMPPNSVGLIVSRDEKPSPDPLYGSQYNHNVLVGECVYHATRSSFIRKY